MSKLNNNLLIQSTVASLFVIFGVVIKNSIEQLKVPNHPIGKPLGMGFFVIGWIYVAYIFSLNRSNKMMFIVPSLAILGAVMMMKKAMAGGNKPHPVLPVIFAISWLMLGFQTGSHLSGNMKYFGLVASVLVLVSMLMILPKQRKQCVVDGPGLPFFTIGWGILIYLNSCR